jgi:putative ABC transport system permease protein
MGTWFKIAARNLLKNGRRSFFTILAIGLGFAAANIFGGFTTYIFTTMKDAYIYAQANGHLTIFKRGFLTHGKLEPVRYLLTQAEAQIIQEVLRDVPEVALVTARLDISGLLSNGKVSTIFVAAGRVPSHVQDINNHANGVVGQIKLYTGKPLQDDVSYGIGVSSELAQQLQLGLDSDTIAMAPTVDGQINALDAQVYQLFEAPLEVLNDKFMLVPLTFAQSLYNTSSVDRLTVLLQETRQTELLAPVISSTLARYGMDVEVHTWKELATIYVRAKHMFDVIFLFIFVIVSIIAIMSVINTISMAVMERIREIGTLRALGVKRQGIVHLFAIESALLGMFGSMLGIGLTLIVWLILHLVQPSWIPPMIVRRIPLEVHLVPVYMLLSTTVLVAVSVGATIFPARKAARLAVVDALGHV